MKLLEGYFISSWSLVADLKKVQADQTDVFTANLAALCLQKYSFPVQILISLPNGTVIHETNANDMLDESHEVSMSVTEIYSDPLVTVYTKFLKEGINQAKKFGYFES